MRIKTFLKLFIFLIILVIISLALYWVKPTKILKDAFFNLATAQTQKFKIVLSVSNPQASLDVLGESASINITILGKLKREDAARDSIEAVVNISSKTDSTTASIEANAIFIGEKAYFLVTKAPPSLPAIAQLKGQWVEMSRGTYNDASKLPTDDDVFLDVEKGDRQSVNGVSAKTYKVSATSAAVIHMLDNIASILGTHLTEEQITNIQKGIASDGSLPVEVAIAPWSRQVLRIKSTARVSDSDNDMSIELTFTDRDEPVDIEAPANALTLPAIAGLKKGP